MFCDRKRQQKPFDADVLLATDKAPMRCEESDGLGKTYQLATIDDAGLTAKLDAAAISPDMEEFKRVDAESQAAQKARSAVRQG